MIDYTAYKRKVMAFSATEPGFIEREVAERLMDKLSFIHTEPRNILCLGSCFGELDNQLQERYPDARVVTADLLPIEAMPPQQSGSQRVSADLDAGLPFASGCFDLVLSNLLLHKLDHTEHFMHELKRVLVPEGMALFTLFGVETLEEIARAWARVDRFAHVHPFFDMHDLGDLALRVGFKTPVLDSEKVTLTYSTPDQAIEDIRALNDPLAHTEMRRGLTGKSLWGGFLAALSAQGSPEGIGVSYELVYAHVIRPPHETAVLQDNEARVTLDSLRQSLKRPRS